MKKMLKTYICYDEKGNKVKFKKYLDSKEYNAGYMAYKVEDLKQLMTIDVYERTEYVQELRFDDNCKNEDGTYKDFSEWKYANTRKYYIHKLWN